MGTYTTLQHGASDVTYEGGGARDDSTGKPRYDLIPPGPLKRVAELYERGGRIRGDHNWTLGVPVSRGIESAMRHLEQARSGDTTEDHWAAVIWNVMLVMHFEGTEWDDRHDWSKIPPKPVTEPIRSAFLTRERVTRSREISTIGEQSSQGDAGLDSPPASLSSH